jgi:Tfp pilus assembly protein PilF
MNQTLEQELNYYLELSKNTVNPNLYIKIGNIYQKLYKFEESLFFYNKAKNIQNSPMLLNNIGVVLQKLKRYSESAEVYEDALDYIKDNPYLYSNLASVLELLGQSSKALEYFLEADRIMPNNPNFYSAIGGALCKLERFSESINYIEKAIRINPNNSNYYFNLALTYTAMQEHHKSIVFYEKSIELNPSFPQAHFNLSIAYLTIGNYQKGWKEHEWRTYFIEDTNYTYVFKESSWKGENLNGQNLYIHSEQGLGDTIQFSRFLKDLKNINGKIIFNTHPELKELITTVKGYDELEATKTFTIEKGTNNILLLSLPNVLNISLSSIKNEEPYISVPQEYVDKWKNKFDNISEFKVGVVWEPKSNSSTHKIRTVPLSNFFDLLKIPNVMLFSLQKGDTIQKLSQYPKTDRFVNLDIEINNFADTSAIIENMDLIISIDTSVIHLAGAMGKPTWTLLAKNPDWRWMLDRDDTPWYPTMKLFRQKTKGDWDSVFENVKKELFQYIKTNDE